MVKRTRRIQQIAFGIFAVLSLVVSSVAACACSHHEPIAESKKSCHETQHHESDSPTVGPLSMAETCVCVSPTNDLSVKSESFKLKRMGGLLAVTSPLEPISYRVADNQTYFVPEKCGGGRVVYPSVLSRGPPLL